MLNILANSFMTATRNNEVIARDVKASTQRAKNRWLPKGHWWLQSTKVIDLDKL